MAEQPLVVEKELPGDVLKICRDIWEYSAVKVAQDTGWVSDQIVYNLESVSIGKEPPWRMRYFSQEHYGDLLRAYPSKLRLGSTLRSRLDRAMQLQAYYKAYGKGVLGEEWQPPADRDELPTNELTYVFWTAARNRGFCGQALPGPTEPEGNERLKRALRELVAFCEWVYNLLDGGFGEDDGRITPENTDKRSEALPHNRTWATVYALANVVFDQMQEEEQNSGDIGKSD
jgi:hypothetical protein